MKFKFLNLLQTAITTLIILQAAPAYSQNKLEDSKLNSWEHLPDGRVVIEVNDRKYAFLYDPEDATRITFGVGKEAQEMFPKENPFTKNDLFGISLKKVVENPAIAKRAFAIAGANIYVPPTGTRFKSSGEPNLAEGKFDPSKLTNAFWESSYRFLNESPPIPSYGIDISHIECAPKYSSVVTLRDSNGFSVAENTKSPKTTNYCLPAKERGFSTPNDLRIKCTNINGDVCVAWFHSAKGNLRVEYAFTPKQFPESEWVALDSNMRDYFNYILMSQELQ